MGLHDFLSWKEKHPLAEYRFSRSREIPCDACGHKLYEVEISSSKDGSYEPSSTIKAKRKKYENL